MLKIIKVFENKELRCYGDHRTMSNHCPSVTLIQQQSQEQSEVVISASCTAPTPVNHRSVPIPVNNASKTFFASVVKQSVKNHHLTKNEAFK